MDWTIMIWATTVAVFWWRLKRVEVLLVETRGVLATARGLVNAAEVCAGKALAAVEELVELAKVEQATAELQERVGAQEIARGMAEPRPAEREPSEDAPPSGNWVAGSEARALRDAAAAGDGGDEPDDEPTQVTYFPRPRLLRGPTPGAGAAVEAAEVCRTEEERAVLAALLELQARLGLVDLATVSRAQRLCRLGHALGVTLRELSGAIAEVGDRVAAQGADPRVVGGLIIKYVMAAAEASSEALDDAGDRVAKLPDASTAPRGAA
jgi:hypothetical protein